MAKNEALTVPVDPRYSQDRGTHLSVAATWEDPRTGAVYVHRDLVEVLPPWAKEGHIGFFDREERFGDVESFVHYVSRYAKSSTTLLAWNSAGLHAILDYANDATDEPGRCCWVARLPFRLSSQWLKWMALTSQALGHKHAVETLEDLAGDIVDPAPADLMKLLRSLRATVNAKADAELRPDGTTRLTFERDAKVQAAGALDLPAGFAIAIPVLRGHVDEAGRPVLYRLDVRLRVSVGDDAKLALRLAIPNAERTLEDVYADRVTAAQALLGDDLRLLRAAD